MSAENKTEEKSSRRRRRAAEAEQKVKIDAAEDIAEETDEVEEDDEEESELTTTSRGLTAKKGRPTPGRRNRVDEEEEGNVVVRGVGGLRGYFQDTIEELKKVSWPTREETLRLTAIVLVVMIISSLVLGAISLFFQEVVRAGIANPIILIGLFFAVVAVVLGFLFYNSRSSNSY